MSDTTKSETNSASTAFSIAPGTHIGPVALTVSDIARSQAFYTEVVGLRVIRHDRDTVALGADDRTPLLVLTGETTARPKPRHSTGLYHFALVVPTQRDLARSLRHLLEAGYPPTGSSDHVVSEALYLNDPDGNGIEIYRDRPRSSWTWDGPTVQMALDPLDLHALLAEADDAPWTGIAPRTTVGHIHLHVANLSAARAFYNGLLGFDITNEAIPGAFFVSAGGYHHHIGLNIWAGQGAPPPPSDTVGLRRFGVVLPDTAHRDHLTARLTAAGVAVEPTPDGPLVRDPSGNALLLTVPM